MIKIEKVRKLSVADVAKALTKSEECIRTGIKTGRFPFGVAIPPKAGGTRWRYIIIEKKFFEWAEK